MIHASWRPLIGVMALLSGAAFAEADVVAGQQKAAACQSCHNADGNSSISLYPKLAGQNRVYLRKHITAFRDGSRTDASMMPMVTDLTDQDIADIAAYYASQTAQQGKADPDLVAQGERLYRGGSMVRGVPSCMACHGPVGNGNSTAGWPAVSGQHADYVAKQLKDYRSGARNTDPNNMMRDIAGRLRDEDIAAVSQYIAGLH